MTANPIDLVGGLTTGANVPKADITAWAKARVAQVLADATELRNTVLAAQLVVLVKAIGAFYALDPVDVTTIDDGLTCIISSDGKRFKPLSATPAPTTVSLGGVFASAAVTNQFVTGLDTAGNLLRAQPSAANLSNGVTGSGAVVLATAPTVGALTAASVNGLTLTASSGTLTLNTNTLGIPGSGVNLNLQGTGTTTQTFPTTSATLARTDAGQTFTGNNTFNGTTAQVGSLQVANATSTAFAAGLNGGANPAFVVDASTALQVAGLSVKGAVTGGTVSLAAIDSGANTNLQIKSKGGGTITLQADAGSTTIVNIGVAASSNGQLVIAGATSGALTVVAPAAASGGLTLAPGTMTGSSASAIWYDNIPQNSKSAAYTTVLADAQKHIFHPSADTTARTWTIDSNANVAYSVGTAITFVNQNAAGILTIAITSDTMRLAGAGTTGSRTLAANGVATALKVTSTEWLISGTGLT